MHPQHTGSGVAVRLADLPARPASSRADFLVCNATSRGGVATALAALQSEGMPSMMQQLFGDRYARSAAAPHISLVNTWLKFHHAVFGDGPVALPPLLVTLKSFEAIAAMFKKGRYRAFPKCVSAIRVAHLDAGHDWPQQLDNLCKWCARSVLRWIGPPRQSQPLWRHDLLALQLTFDPLVDGGGFAPLPMTLLISLFPIKGD